MENQNQYILLVMIALGIISHSSNIAVASSILLIIMTSPLSKYLPIIERHSLSLGLIFLMIYILIPITKSKNIALNIYETITSPIGIISILAGVFATCLNKKGINLLNNDPQLIMGIIIGSLIGITFFDGIPVGPLMPAAIMVIILLFLSLFGIFL